jgi:hypothetical protein
MCDDYDWNEGPDPKRQSLVWPDLAEDVFRTLVAAYTNQQLLLVVHVAIEELLERELDELARNEPT